MSMTLKLKTEELETLNQNWKTKKPLMLSTTLEGTFQLVAKLAKLPPQKLSSDDGLEDLPIESKPQDEDFLYVTYRALSASVLADRPIDFSNERVLRKGMDLLNKQAVYKDHNTQVDNWVGIVEAVAWDKASEGIPAGINADLKIDTIKDPMIARGISLGALHSASVTVSFQWEPSHPALMEEGKFFEKLGETIEDEMVRIVVTEIEKFWEISIVWQGADQYAKKVENNKEALTISGPVADNTKLLVSEFPAQSLGAFLTKKETDYMEKLLKLLTDKFGVSITEENFEAEVASQLLKAETQKEELKSQLKEEFSNIEMGLKKEIEELKAHLEKQKEDVENGKKYLQDTRDEAIRLYKVSKGDAAQAKDILMKTIESANLEVALAWKENFQQEVEAKFPNRCKKCSSTEVSRQSSVTPKEKDDNVTYINPQLAESLKALHA